MDPIVFLAPQSGLRGKLVNVADIEGAATSDVYAFLGVPYAEPPTGDLRFTKPRPASPWNGIRDATQFGAACPQNVLYLDGYPFPMPRPTRISEDCLVLDVWTPSLHSMSRLPVMFWIHGGAFISGFGNVYGGQALAALHKVVVVVINYRIGPLGFLCTNDSAATGNYGILDQLEALKWVQRHIVQFGGDPENVTIFGESAGGMSVSLLVLSPLARGLFRRAIAQSGTVFSGSIIACPPSKAAKTLRTTISKKFPGDLSPNATGTEIVNFLRRQPVDALTTLGEDFNVVIDGHVLPDHPENIYAAAAHSHVELMLGCTSDEGAFLFDFFTKRFDVDPELINVDMARAIIRRLVQNITTVRNAERVTDAVVAKYLQGCSDWSSEDLQKILIEFFGDAIMFIPTVKAASWHSRTCKTFLYIFCHRPGFSRHPQWIRADHGSEVYLLMQPNGITVNLCDEEKDLSRQMMSYWTNFAKTGNPNGDELVFWPEYNETTREYLRLELPVKADSRLEERKSYFWLHHLPKLAAAGSESKI